MIIEPKDRICIREGKNTIRKILGEADINMCCRKIIFLKSLAKLPSLSNPIPTQSQHSGGLILEIYEKY